MSGPKYRLEPGSSDSGVVEGGCGGWHPPNNLEGDGIPQIIKCQGGCYSCSIPQIKLVATKFTTTRQFTTKAPAGLDSCKCEKVNKKNFS
jgi:hypothetical protein